MYWNICPCPSDFESTTPTSAYTFDTPRLYSLLFHYLPLVFHRSFRQRGIPTRFVPEGYLLPKGREGYFAAVRDHDLADSIVFLDPDIGMEVRSSAVGDTRYLHYDELGRLYNRMTEESLPVIYQHIYPLPTSDLG